MANHPINLALRFILEISALVALGSWGGSLTDSWSHYLGMLGVPFLFAVLWGVFRTPGDTSSSGQAPIPIPGLLRLALEIVFFGLATWALFDLGRSVLSTVFGLVTLAHYLVSYDRIGWLLKQ